MSEIIEHPAEMAAARYELALSMEEAQQGVTKILTRNGKKVQVVVPPGVSGGSVVKLGNALQLTDGVSGDILIQIKIKI
jgi:DnaJ-class molecular chaperone